MICTIKRCDEWGDPIPVLNDWDEYIPTEYELKYGSRLHEYFITWTSESEDCEDTETVIAESKEDAAYAFWEEAEDIPDDAVLTVKDCGTVV